MITRTMMIFGAAALMATSAFAQTSTATKTHTAVATHTNASGAKTATVHQASATTTKTAMGNGQMAVHTTKTGKKITYDCSKAGNKNKTACRK